MKKPIPRRFWAKCRTWGEHRIWKESTPGHLRFGYPQLYPARWIYEYHNGPTPEGLRPTTACGVPYCMGHVALVVARGRIPVDSIPTGGFSIFEVTAFGKASAGKCRTREKAIASARLLATLTPTGGVAVYQNDPLLPEPWPVGFFAAGLMGVQT